VGPFQGQRRSPVLVLSAARRRAWTLRDILRSAHVDPVIDGSPLVSVVLSTYNWSNVLRHAVRSVLWQTYPNLELLVIGDACTDDSEEVVASFGDPRVRWVNLETNSGSQAVPNNTGIGLARGDYIAYQGHDDIWHPKHLATMLAYAQRARADLAYCIAEVLGPRASRVRMLTGRVRPADLRPGAWLPPSSLLHSGELARRIGGWRTWEEGGRPDVDFLGRAVESATAVTRVPALTAFKFPSILRPGAYRERPSHEQERYVRRIDRERFFIERELARLALRRLSPLRERFGMESATPLEFVDPKAQFAWTRRVRGLD
jgi:glycosyltransferase involved in cell wall biosynthesis